MALSLELNAKYAPYWIMRSLLKVRNLGMFRAHFSRAQAKIVWYKSDSEEPVDSLAEHGNVFSDSYLDPTEDWNTEPSYTVYFSQDTDSIAVDRFASGVHAGDNLILLHAVIDGSTVATKYRRYCCFEWKSSGSYEEWLRALGGASPTTNEEKIKAGVWRVKRNEEHEYEPQNPN